MEPKPTTARYPNREGIYLNVGDRVALGNGNLTSRGTVVAIVQPLGDLVAVRWDKSPNLSRALQPSKLTRIES